MPTLTRVVREHVPMAFHEVEVTAVAQLTPHLCRITFGGADLAAFIDDGPDQRFKLFLPRPDGTMPDVPRGPEWYTAWRALPDALRPTIRTYTVRSHRPELHEVDVDIVLHGDSGPGSAWASRASVGDRVVIFGVYSEYHPVPEADWHLIAGDQAALPAIGAILERLPAEAPALVLVEVPDAFEEIPLARPVRWVHQVRGESLLTAIRSADFLPGIPYAWVAGESGAVKSIRRHLVNERDTPKESVEFMGYWRLGESIDPA